MIFKNKITTVQKAIFITSLLVISMFSYGQDKTAGKEVFESNCTACHNDAMASSGVYPDLTGISKKRNADWLKSWITDPTKFGEADADAKAVIDEWQPKMGMMPPYSWLSEDEMTNLVAYLSDGEGSVAIEEESTNTETETVVSSGGNTDAGKEIFGANCTSCHQLGANSNYPELVGITKKRGNDWLKSWIKNPAKFEGEDADAKALMAEWKSKAGMMTSFDFLSDEELDNLIAYLAVAKAESKEVATTNGGDGSVTPPVQNDSGVSSMLLALVFIALALLIVVLLFMSAVLNKQLKEKDDAGLLSLSDSEYSKQTHNIFKVLKHPAFIGSIATIGLLLGAWWFLHNVLFAIGVQTGYHPTQPINYSHKIHAGDMGIDCNYCHTGVRKAKHANIPSGSICMTCHTKIKTDSPEIQKLHNYMDYDVKTGKFGDKQTPIVWNRVHNMPDHVYFNHSQHVQVGGLECEECHGEVKEMGTVYQYSTLTMGWCIDCHRNKAINTEGNEYYDKLKADHESSKKGTFTVEENGGLECARCHY